MTKDIFKNAYSLFKQFTIHIKMNIISMLHYLLLNSDLHYFQAFKRERDFTSKSFSFFFPLQSLSSEKLITLT